MVLSLIESWCFSNLMPYLGLPFSQGLGGTLNFCPHRVSPLAYEIGDQHLKLRTTHF